MNMWGPAWVNWWWDDLYFGWAPLSYWGYPGVLMGGQYYGHYYGGNYPYESRALTVVRRDQLKDPGISRNALKGDSLKGLTKMSLTSRNLNLRPAGTKISVQPLDGNRVLLRKDDRSTGLIQDKRIGRDALGTSPTSPRTIRKPDVAGKSQGQASGTSAKPQSIKSPEKGAAKTSGPAKATGNIRKKDPSAGTASSAVNGYMSSPAVSKTTTGVGSARTAYGYPSSPAITRPATYGDGGAARARTFTGPYSRPFSIRGTPGSSSVRLGSSTSGRSSAKVGSSSSGSKSSPKSSSRGSYSRSGSSSSRGSSSGSRSASGGSARRK
jgi:hypothetical protein